MAQTYANLFLNDTPVDPSYVPFDMYSMTVPDISNPFEPRNSASSSNGLGSGLESLPDNWSDEGIYQGDDWSFLDYLKGLLDSSGSENEKNRVYNSAEAAINREFQHNEALMQREWYEAMSNSAYSRAMADMRKAGLNPILAYQQGGAAVSGTGVPSGSASSYQTNGGDTLSNVIGSLASLINALGSTVNGANKNKVDFLSSVLGVFGKKK